MFFTFPEDARWNAERQAVEFGVEIGEYSGVVNAGRILTHFAGFRRLKLDPVSLLGGLSR